MTLSDLERRDARGPFVSDGSSYDARTVWPTAIKFRVVTRGGGAFLDGRTRL